MTDDELKFWEAVYVAAIRTPSVGSASAVATEAVCNRRKAGTTVDYVWHRFHEPKEPQ